MKLPRPGPHGGDGARLAAALGVAPSAVLDLSASLNPVGPRARQVAAAHLDALERYPDLAATEAALGRALGVDVDRVVVTNGGAEAIALVAAAVGGRPYSEPDFGLYPRSETGPRWRSDPHNPTGLLAGPEPDVGVWDEAFYPLATGRWTAGRPGFVVGSLTKVFACPGLRAGYVVAPDGDTARRLRQGQPQWPVNGLAASAIPALVDLADLPSWAAQIAVLRRELVDLLGAHDLRALPSDANFVLVRAAGLRERLAPEGVLVRDCRSFGLAGHTRVAVPDAAGLRRLAAALERTGSRPPRREAPWRAGRAVMVCGTGSHVGKSWIVTGLCRVLAREGLRVAPFKAQNMSLNSGVTPSGHEIGRAQLAQARAAGAEAEASMNPVLLKPTSEQGCAVVVMGRPWAEVDAASYQRRRAEIRSTVVDTLRDLRSRFDVVVMEGAGGAAEINLLDGDLANLGLAAQAGVPALVVGDIERGGVFASLHGTVDLLPPELAATVRGFVVNRFRGDSRLLGNGLADLERRTGIPVLGVVPWVAGLDVEAEDSLSLPSWPLSGAAEVETQVSAGAIDVAVIRFPRISNFTDLDPLVAEPGITLRLVDHPRLLGRPDLVVLPGTRTTVADLEWLRVSGLATAIGTARAAGAAVLGICGGYQMLGRSIDDAFESGRGVVAGLSWLDCETTFAATKVTRCREGRALGTRVRGYQIHHGRVRGANPWMELEEGEAEGSADPGARIWGTTLHGIFENDELRRALLARLVPGYEPSHLSFEDLLEARLDRIADVVESRLDMAAVRAIVEQGME